MRVPSYEPTAVRSGREPGDVGAITMLGTAASGGITIRGTAVPCCTPIATLPTALMADGVALDQCNYRRTLETSGHRDRGGASARIGLGEAPARANCHRT